MNIIKLLKEKVLKMKVVIINMHIVGMLMPTFLQKVGEKKCFILKVAHS